MLKTLKMRIFQAHLYWNAPVPLQPHCTPFILEFQEFDSICALLQLYYFSFFTPINSFICWRRRLKVDLQYEFMYKRIPPSIFYYPTKTTVYSCFIYKLSQVVKCCLRIGKGVPLYFSWQRVSAAVRRTLRPKNASDSV